MCEQIESHYSLHTISAGLGYPLQIEKRGSKLARKNCDPVECDRMG